jgi:hypothetical protein
VGFGAGRVGEDAAGPAQELLQPRRWRSVQVAQRAVQDVAGFQLPARADRGGGEVGGGEVGDVVMQRASVRVEQLAELTVSHQVIAVGEGGDTERVPGPGGDAPALRRVDAGQSPGRVGAGRGRVRARGPDGGDGHVGGRPLRVRGDGQGPAGQIFDPVRLAGGQGDRGGRYQPPGLVLTVRAQLGGTLQGQRRGRRTAAALRLPSGGLKKRRDLFVRWQRRRRQVPCLPVGLIRQRRGQSAVRGSALCEWRGVVDGRADQGMGKLQPGPVHLNQAQPLGRGQHVSHQPVRAPCGGAGACPGARAAGNGGQEQRGPAPR